MPPRHHRQSGLSMATWPTLLSTTAPTLAVGAVLAGYCSPSTASGRSAPPSQLAVDADADGAGATRTGLSSRPHAGSPLVRAVQALRRGAGSGSG